MRCSFTSMEQCRGLRWPNVQTPAFFPQFRLREGSCCFFAKEEHHVDKTFVSGPPGSNLRPSRFDPGRRGRMGACAVLRRLGAWPG